MLATTAGSVRAVSRSAWLRWLAEELDETGLTIEGSEAFRTLLLEEIDHALRPEVHEGRVVSSGTILDPRSDPSGWERGTQLAITRGPVDRRPLSVARLFADGLSSFLLRRSDGVDEWMVFDRPAGSERDLVVLAELFDAHDRATPPGGRRARRR